MLWEITLQHQSLLHGPSGGKSLDKALLLTRGGGTAHYWPGNRTGQHGGQSKRKGYGRVLEGAGSGWEKALIDIRLRGLASLILFSVQDILKVRV